MKPEMKFSDLTGMCGFVATAAVLLFAVTAGPAHAARIEIMYEHNRDFDYYSLWEPNEQAATVIWHLSYHGGAGGGDDGFVAAQFSSTARLVGQFEALDLSNNGDDYWITLSEEDLPLPTHSSNPCGMVVWNPGRVLACPIAPSPSIYLSDHANRIAWFLMRLELEVLRTASRQKPIPQDQVRGRLLHMLGEVPRDALVVDVRGVPSPRPRRVGWILRDTLSRVLVEAQLVKEPLSSGNASEIRMAGVRFYSHGVYEGSSRMEESWRGLLKAFRDTDDDVRREAAKSVSRALIQTDVPPKRIEVIRRALANPGLDPRVKRIVEDALPARRTSGAEDHSRVAVRVRGCSSWHSRVAENW